MDIKSRELIQEVFPDITDIRGGLNGYETLYSNAKAKALLGWQPVHHWRDYAVSYTHLACQRIDNQAQQDS